MTTAKEATYKLVKSVKDDKFSIDKIERYRLIIQIGKRDLQVCIVDTNQNRTLFLEDYILSATRTDAEKVAQLKEVFERHHLLMVGFWKEVQICFKSEKFALVPLSYFNKENARILLNMNCHVEKTDSVGYYKLNSNNSVNIFTFNKAVLGWLRSVYVNCKIKVSHQSGMLVNSALKNTPYSEGKSVAIYIDRFYLHISVTSQDKLLFFNSFPIGKFEDYSKYIALTLHEFRLDKSNCNLKLWGHIKEGSSHFKALKNDFTSLEVGNRTTQLNFGYKFDEIPEHQYSDVYGNYLNH